MAGGGVCMRLRGKYRVNPTQPVNQPASPDQFHSAQDKISTLTANPGNEIPT